VKEFLSQNNVEFTYVNITESMANLKAFLRHRDNNPVFDSVKKEGRVGLPCIVVNDGEKFIFGQPALEDLR
jgi:glutaredoxin-related protein